MSELKLKPCPFCGGEAVLKRVPFTAVTPYYVRCDNRECAVMAATCNRETAEEAIELWNRRANDERHMHRQPL